MSSKFKVRRGRKTLHPACDLTAALNRFDEALPLWTPFEFTHLLSDGGEVFGNSRYTVVKREIHGTNPAVKAPPFYHLSIHDHDRTTRHDWRDLLRIKDELCGASAEAIEFYPPRRYVVDTANEYHLFILPEGQSLIEAGIGFNDRLVSEVSGHPLCERTRQRAWPDDNKPPDLLSAAEFDKILRKAADNGEIPQSLGDVEEDC